MAYHQQKWSEADKERMRALWGSGLTYAQIGEALGRSPEAIHRKATYLGLPRKGSGSRWTPEQDSRLSELWASSLTSREIGAELGKSASSVRDRVQRLKLPPRHAGRRESPPRAQKAQERSRAVPFRALWKRKNKPTPLPAPEPIPETAVAFAKRNPWKQCGWPVAGVPGPDMVCCGGPIFRGSYCRLHTRKAYTKADVVAA